MSVVINYKGEEILSVNTDTTKTLKTSGKYCEADIEVVNTPDSGDAPVINPLSVTANGTYTAPSGVDGYSPVTVNVPQGITPSGSIEITENGTYDVTEKASAVVNVSGDAPVINPLSVTSNGTYTAPSGVDGYSPVTVNVSGGSLPSSIGKNDGGSFTLAADAVCSQYEIAHNMGVPPMGFTIWTDELNEFATQSKQYMMWVNTRIFTVDTNSTTTRYGLYGSCARQSSGNVYQNQAYHYDVESAERWCNATRIKAHIADHYFKAGITYKWVAWA